MGATFNTVTFNKDDKEKITADWDDMVEESLYNYGHSYSGDIGMLHGQIKWASVNPLEDEEAAEEYICNHHQKWEPAMAVPFKNKKKTYYVLGGWCSD